MTDNHQQLEDKTSTENILTTRNNILEFKGINLMKLIEKHGTPLRFFYLPKIKEQISKAKKIFHLSIKRHSYKGKYVFCYCTKCNYFPSVIEKALDENINIESSSAFDIDIIICLYKKGKIDKNRYIIHNGFKTDEYLTKIYELIKLGFHNSIIILDSKNELDKILKLDNASIFKIGIRMSVNENSHASYSVSRFGFPEEDIIPFFEKEIKNNIRLNFLMIHFFAEKGIKNNVYYWNEFDKALNTFTEIKKSYPMINYFNIGGGFPITTDNEEQENICNKIISSIKEKTNINNIPEPDIFTEFGKYTVAQSGAFLYEILEHKKQSKEENWYIIDSSIMGNIPDIYSIAEKFPLRAINLLDKDTIKVNIGGLTCDSDDYYNKNENDKDILLPQIGMKEKLYIGIFNTGAYQDAISGYGGIKHCLIASPKYIMIDKDANGNIFDYTYSYKQSAEDVLNILKY